MSVRLLVRRLFSRKPRPLDPRAQARIDDLVRRTSPEAIIAELERESEGMPAFQRETLDYWTPQLRKPEPAQLLITSSGPPPSERLRDLLDRAASDDAPDLSYIEWSAPTPWGDQS